MPYQREGVPVMPPRPPVVHHQFVERQRVEPRKRPYVVTAGMRAAMTRPINHDKPKQKRKPKPRTTARVYKRSPGNHLSPAQKQDIYRRVHAGERACDLAKEFGVSGGTVSCIKRGKTSLGKPKLGRPKAFRHIPYDDLGNTTLMDGDD